LPHGPLLRWPFFGSTLPGLLVASLLVMAGCSVGEFLGAYFNTYYNAQRAFSEAELELLNAQDPKRSEKGYLTPYVVPAGAKTKFTSVIEKCSKLLQYHPESNFVDDALMMIGKSYYYQNENQSAERKFRELIEGQPTSDLVPEARLLLANTLYRSGNVDGAREAARKIVGAEEDAFEPVIRSRAALLIATIELDAKNYQGALDGYATAAKYADTSEDRFSARMRMAEMFVLLKNDQRAGESYSLAEEDAADYLTEYRAKLGRARELAAVGDHEEALSQLEDLLSNSNNKDMYGEIEFEIGNTYRLMGDTERAVDQYHYVDTAYARTEFSARALYELGLLYEKQLLKYDSARVAYARGRTSAGQAPIAASLTVRSEAMNRYASLRSEVAKNESLRIAILFPPDTLAIDSLAPAHDTLSVRNDSLKHGGLPDTAGVTPDRMAEGALHSPPGDTTNVPKDSLVARSDTAAGKRRWVPVPIPLDTVQARLALGKSELGALFFNTMEVNDSASYWFTRLLADHPGSVYVPRALYTLAQIARQDSQPDVADSLYRILAEQYGKTEFGGSARKLLGYNIPPDSSDGSEELYRSAEQALESGQPTVAVNHLNSIISGHPGSPWAPKADYAAGWIYEQILAVPESAEAHYRSVGERFPGTPYAAAVRPKLDAIDQYNRAKAAEEQARNDSLTRATPPPKSDTTAIVPPPPDDTVHDSTGIPPPGMTPDEENSGIKEEPPPEVQPDSNGNENAEPPPPDPGELEQGNPPPPGTPGPGGSGRLLR
jgi:TolA-binding protein